MLFALPKIPNVEGILVFAIVIVIIIAQTKNFLSTLKRISAYRNIFPGSSNAFSIEKVGPDGLSDEDGVSQIRVNKSSGLLKNIIDALNGYLLKNSGASSDFHLMKDVVERYCDAEEDEIATQQPIPLYLGLMGTMVGIIVGIGSIALAGGLDSEKLTVHINELMLCVAIAMLASFLGVLYTTIIAAKSKDANKIVEGDKNAFYSWLQSELLPVLSGNTVSEIHLLSQNLVRFNQTFSDNISGLSDVLSQVSTTSSEQAELIRLIQGLDIARVAKANIAVLKELQNSTGEIAQFNAYLHNVRDYLTAVNSLNENLKQQLDRTQLIENMGEFFQKEAAQFENRQALVNKAVTDVDSYLQQSFDELKSSYAEGVEELRKSSASNFDELRNTLDAEKRIFKDCVNQEQKEFTDYVKAQTAAITTRSKEIDNVVGEMKSLSGLKSAMTSIASAMSDNNDKLAKMLGLLKNQQTKVSRAEGNGTVSRSLRPLLAGVVALLFVIAGLIVFDIIREPADFGQSYSPETEYSGNNQQVSTSAVSSAGDNSVAGIAPMTH